MPVIRSSIPYRKSRRLHSTDVAYDDELWETYDESLLASSSSASVPVKFEPNESYPAPLVSPDSNAGHIPRPRNAFICFRSEYVKAPKGASVNQTVLSCGAAEVWRGMDDEERAPFVLMAQEEKEEHARMYPNYRYAPGSTSGASRKNKKPKPAASRRASTATSDSSDVRVRSPTHERRRKYRTNPPAPRPVPRRKSTPVTPRAPRISPAAIPVAVAETIESIAEVSEPVPPAVEDTDEKKDEPIIVRSPLRPSSYDRSPTQFGFKADLSPTTIASLSLASRGPSRSPSPSPLPSPLIPMPSLSFNDPADIPPSLPPSPAPPAPAFEVGRLDVRPAGDER
ncbi:putative transcription factor SOX-14 [Mycena venus]|uniref:Putative transcription factor SOX-14 n=1 Tax=Mycena venus TaxID=2733690 RepID=A0A8H6X728_9AGAR|nr:putative transcription factor SOX-14 [Mycena venus]